MSWKDSPSHIYISIIFSVNGGFGLTSLELQSRLMSHEFSFKSVFDTSRYWTHMPMIIYPKHGIITALQSGNDHILTRFNVVPGNLIYSFGWIRPL